MSRIRSIKPSFWTSAQVMDCRPLTRLFFIGLWNFCDDEGRHAVSEKQLRALIFPGDDLTLEAVRAMLDELARNDLIVMYEVGGKEYLQVTGWHHQKIDKAQKSKIPEAPFDDWSRPIPERSPNGSDGREGKGEDRKGKDKSSREECNPDTVVPDSSAREAKPGPFAVIGGGRR